MPVEAYQAYWLHEHAGIIKRLPGIRRYVQSHPLPENYRDGEPVCDGIAELLADDTQAFRDMAASDAYAAVQADELKFLDQAANALILTDEHIIKDGAVAPGGVKRIELVTCREDLEIEDFQRYWREVHGPIAAGVPMLRRYIQYHPRPGGYARGRRPAYDGLDVTWFDSIDSMNQAAASAAHARGMADRPNFMSGDDCPVLLTREHVIIA